MQLKIEMIYLISKPGVDPIRISDPTAEVLAMLAQVKMIDLLLAWVKMRTRRRKPS